MKDDAEHCAAEPNPFHILLRAMVAQLQMQHLEVAEILGVPLNTLENWMVDPEHASSRLPHRLVQLGVMKLLNAKISTLRKGLVMRKWIVTKPDGSTHSTSELRDWVSRHYPGENAATVAAALSQRGKYVRLGLTVRKEVYTFKDPPQKAPGTSYSQAANSK
ncbi:MAG: hypothetical protein JWR60_3870 [Polaromonas sp.]|nr:hypothetical protein [Polaromonas sp.]